MRIVGLTGGISSGKSTVSNLFKAQGLPVVDADVVARWDIWGILMASFWTSGAYEEQQLVDLSRLKTFVSTLAPIIDIIYTRQDALKKGTRGWKKVVKAFGDDILLPDGEMDRPKLGRIVFSDPDKRQLLNRLLAPSISSGILQEILKLWLKGHKVIVLDIPLLFEAKMDKWTKPIIVVWVDRETQQKRLVLRDRITDDEANNKINAQMPLDSKRSKADIVIDNTGSLDDLNDQFQNVLRAVTRPLTWSEFMLSRQGAFSAFAFVVLGILLAKNKVKCDGM